MAKKTKVGGLKTHIWKACGTDEIRPALICAYVQNGYIYATNAQILIRQKLETVHNLPSSEIANLEGKYLHRELLKELEKYELVRFNSDSITAVKNGVTADFRYTECEAKYPNAEAVIPSNENTEPISYIGLNTKLLKLLTECMTPQYSGHRLNFSGSQKVIIVTGVEYSRNDELGLIMPARVETP